MEQVFRAQARRRYVLALLFIEVSFEQQIRHPQNAAQGCSDLMAEVGEEGALQPFEFDSREIRRGIRRHISRWTSSHTVPPSADSDGRISVFGLGHRLRWRIIP